ncbi:thymidylate synthase [Mesobacillus jeotgali]|uniref:thymidylate synthase n=1 Tax=Mesobacillus jeotgali TaxID=129985 RepID=UPI000C863070|nr:thymidylate synthase [Mesobacillus jeotgali]
MINFNGTDFNKIYYDMLKYAYFHKGEYINSRVGEVKDLGPATFEISEDNFRLIHLNNRAINPFFALTEFSWIIEGSNELKPLQHYINNYHMFSDDGSTLNGAYGFRLKHYFKKDQIEEAIKQLKERPNSRRVVLSMWSVDDLAANSNDLPCNISILLKVRKDKLDITVLNRSNDIFLGVPYNVFVFYLLQVYIAEQTGYQIGVQRHFTDSLHLYKKHENVVREIVQNNNYDTISFTKELNNAYKLNDFVGINHRAVLNREYKNIGNDELKNFFEVFENYKQGMCREKIIDLLPNNILGYISYKWIKHYEKLEISENKFYEIEKEIFTKTKPIYAIKFDTLKYYDTDDIIKDIKRFAELASSRYEKFYEVISKDEGLFILRPDDPLVDIKFLHTVGLSLVFADIYSVYSPDLRKNLIEKMQGICKLLNISIKDVLSLTLFEEEFLGLINE